MKIKISFSAGLVTLLVLFPTTVRAQDTAVVSFSSGQQQTRLMEVFVSQGCSSCLPAQDWINQWVDQPQLWTDVIPVVFHVDYWDYLGWPDPFASPLYTQKQYDYKFKEHVRSVYTPGFVVNGREWRGWFQRQALPQSQTAAGMLSAQLKPGQLQAHYSLPAKGQLLNVAVLGFGLKTAVTAGENRNQQIQDDFAVLAFDQFPSDEGQWAVAVPLPRQSKPSRYALAVWVSSGNDPTPLQATGGWLPAAVITGSE